jgi:hypothetical protein
MSTQQDTLTLILSQAVSGIVGAELRFDPVAQHVAKQDMALLNARRLA